MPIPKLVDLSGGYATDLSPSEMSKRELLTAENCYWTGGSLKKRLAFTSYATISHSPAVEDLSGEIRAKIAGTWYTFLAVDDGSDMMFFKATTTSFAEIDVAFTWPTGYDVQFAFLDDKVVGTNGQSEPLAIYNDSGIKISNLEATDARTRINANWVAGQWDESGTGDTQWINDTEHAQDAALDNFQIGSAVDDDGCFVACDFTFNKIVFGEANQATRGAGNLDVEYTYWNGTSFAALSLISTPDFKASDGDKTLEFNFPTDWESYAVAENYVKRRFVIRIRFEDSADSPFFCDTITVSHTQFLRQVLSGNKPLLCYTWNNRMLLTSGTRMYIGPYNSTDGWDERDIEYFAEGGEDITALSESPGSLLVFKNNKVFPFRGTSHQNWTKGEPLDIGTTQPRSAIMVDSRAAMWIDSDARIHLWNGKGAAEVSYHIQTDLDSYTLTGACAVSYKGSYWLSFPASSIVLRCDPDTLRQDPSTGKYRVSWYKYTGYRVDKFSKHGVDDDGLLLGLQNVGGAIKVARLENTNLDLGATAPTISVRTRDDPGKVHAAHKIYTRVKPMMSRDGNWTFTIYSDETRANTAVTIASGSGSSRYVGNENPPYTLDGFSQSYGLTNALANQAEVFGYEFEYEEIPF